MCHSAVPLIIVVFLVSVIICGLLHGNPTVEGIYALRQLKVQL